MTGPWRGVISVARFPREAKPFEIWKVSLDHHFLDISGLGVLFWAFGVHRKALG